MFWANRNTCLSSTEQRRGPEPLLVSVPTAGTIETPPQPRFVAQGSWEGRPGGMSYACHVNLPQHARQPWNTKGWDAQRRLDTPPPNTQAVKGKMDGAHHQFQSTP
uniref:Uncharacterized protein n=1 Tax=Bionectria ochroleuca TaxID=29856 RepID=A0A8H7NLI6_BIOOC